MKTFKKILRVLIRILATPVMLIMFALSMVLSGVAMAIHWIYEDSEWEKQLTRDIIKEDVARFRKWFGFAQNK